MSKIIIPDGCSTGLIPRDFTKDPLGSLTFAGKMPQDKLIPYEKIVPKIKEKEAAGSTLLHVWKRYVRVVLYQNGIGYCHAFSPTMGAMVMRAKQGLKPVLLSASSIGGPVTGYRNSGAYVFNDLKQSVNGGFCPVNWEGKEIYPMTTTKNYMSDKAKQLAMLTRFESFWEGNNRNDHEVISCLLRNMPVMVGYNWWGHAVTLLWVTVYRGVIYYIGINSWKASWQQGMDSVPDIKALLEGGGGFFAFPVGKVKEDTGEITKLGSYGEYLGTPDEWYCGISITEADLALAV